MIQPLVHPFPSAPAPELQTGLVASGELLLHITTPPPKRMDSLLANRMSAKKLFTLPDIT